MISSFDNFDIVVVGAGFSGVWFVNFIDSKFKVLIIDRKRDLSNYKSSGLLTRGTFKLVRRYNGLSPSDIVVKFDKLNVVSPFGNVLRSVSKRPIFYLLSDNFLEKTIDRAIKKNKNITFLKDASLINIIKHDTNYRLTISVKNRTIDINSKIIIAADGAISTVKNLTDKVVNNRSKDKKFLDIVKRSNMFKIRKDNFLLAKEFMLNLDLATPQFKELVNKGVYHIWLGKLVKGYGGWFFVTKHIDKHVLRLGFADSLNTFNITKEKSILERIFKVINVEFNIDVKNLTTLYKYSALIPIGGLSKMLYLDNIFFIGDSAGFCGSFAADGLKGAFVSAFVTANFLNNYETKPLIRGKFSNNEINKILRNDIERQFGLISYYKKQKLLRKIWLIPWADWQYDFVLKLLNIFFGKNLGDLFLKLKERS